MKENNVLSGVVHEVPTDLRNKLIKNDAINSAWKSLTPLARNEWICWCISVKKPETRKTHIQRTAKELLEGKRRPCCWAGCPHRGAKP